MALTGEPLRRLVEAMPKAELHLHLDGSLRVATALELARTRGIDAPTTWAGMSAALIAPMPCRDQAELLRAFDLPIALMQDAEALERITAELVETKAADNVRYVEIRWGPLLHVARRPVPGRRHRRGLCRGLGRRGTHGDHGPAHLHGAPLARPGRERGARRDGGPLPRSGADRLGPGRSGGGLPGPDCSMPRPSRPPGPAACGSRSTPGSGAAPRRSAVRSRWIRNGSPTDRGPSTTRRCAPS